MSRITRRGFVGTAAGATLAGHRAFALGEASTPGVQEPSGRPPGTKVDVGVCTPPLGKPTRSLGYFANAPQVILTPNRIVLSFGMAEIDKLQNLQTHHHYHSVSVHHWSISDDGGHNWVTTDRPPSVGRIIDASYGEPLQDGGMVTMTFMRPHVLCYALIQKGQVGWMPYSNGLPSVQAVPLTDVGPYPTFKFHTMDRTSDGALLAAGSAYSQSYGRPGTRGTSVFLRSEDEGRSWRYFSQVPNPHPFWWGEPGILAGSNGKVLALLRVDRPRAFTKPEARYDPNARWDYLYQTESHDNGLTWSRPVKTPVWGHPAYLKRLQSGALLLVYGHRRPPFSVRAILSRDEGRSWDLKTMKELRVWEPGNFDLGYPQATQLEDGTILCAYYGYYTEKVKGRLNPCGIFVSLFDEEWLEKGNS